MEELQNSTAEAKTPAESRWYEGVGLEDAEIYIRANLKSAARSVIAIGYYLKCVKAKELFAEAGFKDIYEYARERFGFSSSTTSRYMTRNDKFSVNGNSPLLDEKYKNFNKSQLQEMLSLDAEQLQTVTPDMTVAQIREMKRPKEIPYVAIPGQREMLADFPGITPEDVATAAKAREAAATGRQETPTYTISAEDLLPDPEPQETEQSIAISQQETKPAQPERTGKCIHRPDLDFECSLAEEYKHIPGNGTNCDRACCWDCTERSKGCRLECYSSERRPEEPHEEQNEEPAAVMQQEPEEQIPTEQMPIERGCITGLSRYGNCVCCGYDGVECCAQCDESCNSRCGWLEDEKAESVDKEPELEPEPEEDTCDQETPITELQIAQEELERAKKLLKDGLEYGVDENDVHIRRLKTKVCAWASYVCDLDSIVNPPPKPVQPELPPLKNNDQRAAFLDAYETWPLWIETEQTGERYYRYDLEDGTSMVVKVYHARIFDGYTPGSYEAQYHDGYGRQEYYLLQAGKFFRDCETNRSLLIEKLKEIQKLKKG